MGELESEAESASIVHSKRHLPEAMVSAAPVGHLKPTQGGTPAGESGTSAVGVSELGRDLSKEEVQRQAKGLHLLSLFHGPLGRSDGLDLFVEMWGCKITCYDLEICLDHDLCDDATWEVVKDDIQAGVYAGAGMAMPCGSFSAARSFEDGGPVPLRGEFAPEIYGLSGLSPEDKAKVAVGTLLALRGCEAASLFHGQNKPFWGETPAERAGAPQAFKLPGWIALRIRPGVQKKAFVQCELGAPTKKHTDVMHFLLKFEFPTECTHQSRWWTMPWSGASVFAPHPQLWGTQWMVPSEDWRPEMLRWYPPKGPYISRSAAAYPGPMNEALAETWVRGAVAARVPVAQAASMFVTGVWANTLVRRDLLEQRLVAITEAKRSLTDSACTFVGTPQVFKKTPLRPSEASPRPALQDPACCVCGVVDTWKAIDRVPQNKVVGQSVAALIDSYFDDNPVVERMLIAAIGSDKVNPEILENAILPLRGMLAGLLASESGPPDISEIKTDTCSTPIRAHLLKAWAVKAMDPGASLCEWLISGAPAGIAVGTPELDTLFPQVPPTDSNDQLDELVTDPDEIVNYQGVDENEDVAGILRDREESECLKGFDSLQETRDYLGADPVISKIGAVVKEKLNDKGVWTKKTRIIVDANQSGISKRARRTHRSTLPRATHAIQGALGLTSSVDGSTVYLLVADVQDAFWLIPLAWSERRYFVTKFRGRFLVFQRTAQGSRGAPLTWAAIAALVARRVQSVFITPHGQEARLQMYVDDPLLALKGSEARRARLAARFLFVWLLLGMGVAFPKARFDRELVWIGVKLRITDSGIVASIPAEKAADLLALINECLSKNVLSVKEVRSLAGKAMNIASLLYVWRPFLASCWAAIAAEEPTNAPQGCIWTKQVSSTLYWLKAFLSRECGQIERHFTLDAFFNKKVALEITTDASPWGIGGWISLDGKPLAWFADQVTETDALMLQREVGSHLAQQGFEALAILVAIRH